VCLITTVDNKGKLFRYDGRDHSERVYDVTAYG
jgi:hypothetical protein